MAKTFDNISEASTTNYLFLFTQRALALKDEPPTPPPLNALGLPFQVMCKLWASVNRDKLRSQGQGQDLAVEGDLTAQEMPVESATEDVVVTKPAVGEAAAAEKTVEENPETSAAGKAEIRSAVLEKRAADKACSSTSSEEAKQEGEKAAEETATDETFAKTIALLAKEITEYIIDHQDDVAQEERWRSHMKRGVDQGFRLQRETAQKVETEMKGRLDSQHEEMRAMHLKLDLLVEHLNDQQFSTVKARVVTR